jgi:hypothetical protein
VEIRRGGPLLLRDRRLVRRRVRLGDRDRRGRRALVGRRGRLGRELWCFEGCHLVTVAPLERAQRLRGRLPLRPDELPVVGIPDLARAVVELELLQRGERTVSLLDERPPLVL